jgi:hypothetical protein
VILQSKIAIASAWNQKISDVFKIFTELQDIFAVFLDVEDVSWAFHQRLIEAITNLSILRNFGASSLTVTFPRSALIHVKHCESIG